MGFTEFDSSTEAGASSTTTGKFSLRKRELILAVVAVVACVLVLVLAIVLAVKLGDSSECDNDNASKNGSPQTGASTEGQDQICESFECINMAAYQMPIMKTDVKPCQDFYEFACGNYAKQHPQTPREFDVTPNTQIWNYNRNRLEALLSPEIIESGAQNIPAGQEPNYQQKLATFWQSCTSHFDKMSVRSQPFLDRVIQPVGGWWLFQENVLDSFNLQDSFIKTSVDFSSSAFVTIGYSPIQNAIFKNIVEIYAGSSHLNSIYFDHYYGDDRVAGHFKAYMQKIASMLCQDGGHDCSHDRIVQFSEDVFEVGSLLMDHVFSADYVDNHHDDEKLMTIGQVNAWMEDTIDLIPYFKGIFNEYPSQFNESKKIAVLNPSYFQNLGTTLKTYMNNGTTGKRKLHNYMIWNLFTSFSYGLSWDYVHAELKLLHTLRGDPTDLTVADDCFYTMSVNFFSEALNSFFIEKLINKAGKDEIKNMVTEIRTILEDAIKKLKWMSKENQDYGVQKLTSSLYKLGFPDKLTDMNYMNDKYSFVTVDAKDYFGNVLNLIDADRHWLNSLYAQNSFRHEWYNSYFYPTVLYDNPWQDFIITAAMLQNPLYHHNGPAFYNLATVGTAIASNLVHAVDQSGSQWRIGGSHSTSWWDDSTKAQFNSYRECAARAWAGSDPGSFTFWDYYYEQMYNIPEVQIDRNTTSWTAQLLAASAGVQIGLKAYKNRDLKELAPPGLSRYTPEQLFFISYAQSKCQNTQELVKYFALFNGEIAPSKESVNLALAQVPEFQAAFNCPAVDNQPEPCQLFEL